MDRSEPRRFSISELFHENTKMRRDARGHPMPLVEPSPRAEALRHALLHPARIHRTAERVEMERASVQVAQPLEEVLRKRRSYREYAERPLPVAELSCLLELSYGVTGQALLEDATTPRGRRPAPSAGALYPVELYCAALNVSGLRPGLYHYDPTDHVLERLADRDVRQELQGAVMYPEIVAGAAAVFLLAAVFQRCRFKYGERGYRFVLLDAGHMAQNLYLVATALQIGVVSIGGFVDDEVNAVVRMDGVNEAVVYLVAVGKEAPGEGDEVIARPDGPLIADPSSR